MGSINCKNLSSTSSTQDSDIVKKPSNECDDYIENVVCNETDIQENEMQQFEIGDEHKVLLVKQYGKLTALGPKCSHYGAPLINGVLGDGHVKCPWHGACFNTKTGDIEDFPGLDSIPCYNVNVKDGKVWIRAKKSDLEKNVRIKSMVKCNPSNGKTFIIVGGGPAAGVCAESLRQEGFNGRIIMICKEYALPYDRVKLTKAMNIDLETLQFRTPEFYVENSIDIMMGVSATKLNTENKTITCSNGEKVKYTKVFVATGSDPIVPLIPNADHLANIMTIRNHVDSHKIFKMLNEEMNVVCLGSNFIALEAASYCVKKAKSVSVIYRSDAPLKTSFGKDVGFQVAKLFEQNGVKMMPRTDVNRCIGINGKITEIELKNGTTIPCDLFIMGTGTRPNTDFLRQCGVKINAFGGVDTDLHLMAAPDIYVGGDIANAPIYSNQNKLSQIGHYQLAQYHGKIAAANMAGNVTELKAVPFFWTQFFGKSLRYAGNGTPVEVAIKGSIEEYNFVIFYIDKEGFVFAVSSCGRDPVVSQFAEFLKQGRRLHKKELAENTWGWIQELNTK